eukprot:SAG31_NODE_1410_length_8470_cov_6.064031_1_plen_123_part_00
MLVFGTHTALEKSNGLLNWAAAGTAASTTASAVNGAIRISRSRKVGCGGSGGRLGVGRLRVQSMPSEALQPPMQQVVVNFSIPWQYIVRSTWRYGSMQVVVNLNLGRLLILIVLARPLFVKY